MHDLDFRGALEQAQTVLAFHNQNQFVRGMLIPRPASF